MSGPVAGVPLLDIARGNSPLREEFIEALAGVIDSGRFLFGPEVSALEQEVARLSQVDHAVGCASGSDALLLALMALDIGPGDEVIVPSFTFFATVSCVTRLGATPVFADINPRTFNIDPAAISAAITPATRAIIPVHLFGQCAEIDAICRMATQKSIAVVEDACQAIGAAYHSRAAGSWGQIGCFSFYPTKNLGGMGDGGMLTAAEASLAERLRLFAAHGMQPRYHHSVIGINSRLDTFQAAVLGVKMKHLPAAVAARQANAARYTEMFTDAGLSEAIVLPAVDPHAYHVWNQYAIRVEASSRDPLRRHLAADQIGTEVYYPIPVHSQACYADQPWSKVELPETELAAREILNLPIFPELTVEEQERVVGSIGKFFANQNRAAA